MRKAATFFVLQVGLALAASPIDVVGQQATTSQPDSAQIVVVSEKSPWVAGALEYFVPTLGYGYAGNWVRGLPPTAVRLVGFGIFLSDQFTVLGPTPPCEDKCVAGLALALVGSIWAIADAAAEAKRFNARQRSRTVVVSPTLSPRGWGVSVSLPVR